MLKSFLIFPPHPHSVPMLLLHIKIMNFRNTIYLSDISGEIYFKKSSDCFHPILTANLFGNVTHQIKPYFQRFIIPSMIWSILVWSLSNPLTTGWSFAFSDVVVVECLLSFAR